MIATLEVTQATVGVDELRFVRGRPVRAGNLDGFMLRRALRGGELPDAEAYIEVTPEMLDAVDEAGPLPESAAKRGRKR